METIAPINPDRLVDGHFVDLDTLREHLDYLRQNGVKHVIIATGKWFNDNGNLAFGSTENGEGSYGYMLRTVIGFNRLSDDAHYIPGNRWLHCSDQLMDGAGHAVGSISDADFEQGSIARIVTNPEEVAGINFSYDQPSPFEQSYSEIAIGQMPLVAELQQQLIQ